MPYIPGTQQLITLMTGHHHTHRLQPYTTAERVYHASCTLTRCNEFQLDNVPFFAASSTFECFCVTLGLVPRCALGGGGPPTPVQGQSVSPCEPSLLYCVAMGSAHRYFARHVRTWKRFLHYYGTRHGEIRRSCACM